MMANDQSQTKNKMTQGAAMIAKKCLILFLSLLSMLMFETVFAQSAKEKNDAKKFYEQALELHQQKKDEEAIPLLRKSVSLDSEQIWAKKLLVEILVAKGEKLFDEGYQKTAYGFFSEAMKLWSNHPSVSYWFFKLRPIQDKLVDKPPLKPEAETQITEIIEPKMIEADVTSVKKTSPDQNAKSAPQDVRVAEKEAPRIIVERATVNPFENKAFEQMMKMEERMNRQMMLILESQGKNQPIPAREIIQIPATEKESPTLLYFIIGLGFIILLIFGVVFLIVFLYKKQDNSNNNQRPGYEYYHISNEHEPSFFYQSSPVLEYKNDKKNQDMKAISYEENQLKNKNTTDQSDSSSSSQKKSSDMMDLRTVLPLARIVDSKVYRRDQSIRVGKGAYHMAVALHLSPQDAELYYLAGLAHDVGYLDVSSEILNKQGELSFEEFEMIKGHPEKGINLLQFSHIPTIVHDGIMYHHERWNGSGYPKGLKGEEIPLVARVVALVDTFEALISPRPYRPPFSEVEALEKIYEGLNTYFDPELIESFDYVVNHHMIFKETRFEKKM